MDLLKCIYFLVHWVFTALHQPPLAAVAVSLRWLLSAGLGCRPLGAAGAARGLSRRGTRASVLHGCGVLQTRD